ncbi:hypothetical protein TI39_contig446g00001 [Zymoseptoria brevis]|uniref:Uncharacterized protein n=1 Tax=Zymoseptoria brevis TaxID=1047168 RepID=A0A0F4GKR4_9PEZI|nr:hypothetical protein TI39_contig446g00001 [Zymoseptoria brevis]
MANNKMADSNLNDTGEFSHMIHVQQGIMASFGNGSNIQDTDQANRPALTSTEEHIALQGFMEDEYCDAALRSIRAEKRKERLAKASQDEPEQAVAAVDRLAPKNRQERIATTNAAEANFDDSHGTILHNQSSPNKRKHDLATPEGAAQSGRASKSIRREHKADGGETKAEDTKTLADLELELVKAHRKACEAKLEILEAEKEELKLAIQRRKSA